MTQLDDAHFELHSANIDKIFQEKINNNSDFFEINKIKYNEKRIRNSIPDFFVDSVKQKSLLSLLSSVFRET